MKNIVLIGMPGSGKTTIGKTLSLYLQNHTLIDSDEEIVKNEGMTINEIFKVNGEKYFRELETKTIKSFLNRKEIILSTGGGIVEREENLEILKEIGYVVYLFCDIETLLSRVKNNNTRPLLNAENQKERLERLFLNRNKKYEKANYIIDTKFLNVKEIAEKILEEINYGRN